MSKSDDIARILEQESQLVFERFDEDQAFAVGSLIRQKALSRKLGLVVDIRTWDRPLFYCATAGSTGSNPEWARRKSNVVRRFGRSTYRMVLELDRPDRTFPVGWALNPEDFVVAGGGFPLKVQSAGVIGSLAVSGLPERDDHGIIIEALCEHLGLPYERMALPA